jgi:hypothetical protein
MSTSSYPTAKDAIHLGTQVAATLVGSWRLKPPIPESIPSADSIPLLLAQGVGGLAWNRLRGTDSRKSAAARALREESRQLSVQALLVEERIGRSTECLRSADCEPLLIKGWSAARLYPMPGVRPLGDIDLCVRSDQIVVAAAALTEAEFAIHEVDLHRGLPDLPDRSWSEVYRHTGLVDLGGLDLRILGPEDHLRLLCLHFVRHLGFRPLWLCDVAVAVEAQPPDFDWDYCLSGKRRLTEWVLCVLGLARRLLGARIGPPEIAARTEKLPRWLEPCVLWQWGTARPEPRFRDYLARPAELGAAIRYRWLNTIRAAWRMRMRPRRSWLLIQSASLLGRPVEVVVRMQRGLAKRFRPMARPFELHREGVF